MSTIIITLPTPALHSDTLALVLCVSGLKQTASQKFTLKSIKETVHINLN